MCGIAGYYLEHEPERGALAGMTARLAHRGPDGEGFLEEGRVGLGHRRLSIIDLETGAQPIRNEDGRVAVICNGEIYNFRGLRKGLQGRGHVFRTSSDTEVLVHLYEEHGELFPARLEGIFAFALYDAGKKLLILGRDQVGVKPLYYAVFGEGLLFGSEPKALLGFPGFSPTLDRKAAALYFQMEYFPAPLTPFREMKKLLPGHVLAAASFDRIETRRYNTWEFEDLSSAEEEEIVRRTRQAVTDSVSAQLMSDVPLGVFLSGGVDSACVAAAMRSAGAEVRSFSAGFEDRRFDESAYASEAALHLGTDHSGRTFGGNELFGELDRVLAHMDEPLADPSIFPTALLSRFAREKVTVALGGDGGDELFCGYPTYLVHKFFPLYGHVPAFLRKPAFSIADAVLPVGDGNLTFSYKFRKFMDGSELGMPDRHFAWMGAYNRAKLEKLMPGADLDFSALSWIGPPPRDESVCGAEWLDLHTYLMEDVLQKVDRMSMLSSLEVRVPLLAPSVVKLAFSIPSKMKLRGNRLKGILKNAFEKDLPPGYFDRPKKGFAVPMSAWLRGPLRERVADTFRSTGAPFLDLGEASRLLEEHADGRRDNRKLIWTVFVFLKWLENRAI